MAYMKVYIIPEFVRRVRGKPWKPSVKTAGILAKIQTKYLPDTRAEHYQYTLMPDIKLLYEIVRLSIELTCAYLVVIEMNRFYTDSHLVWNACGDISEIRIPVCIAD